MRFALVHPQLAFPFILNFVSLNITIPLNFFIVLLTRAFLVLKTMDS